MTMPNGSNSHNANQKGSSNTIEGRRKALIIGISNYNSLIPLDLCKDDGEEVYKVLSSQAYEISDNHKLIGNVPYGDMRKAIVSFFKSHDNRPKDTLLFYYSGHGLPDEYGKHYLAASDIDKNNPFENGVSFDDLEYLIESSTSNKIVTILDCCFSGAAGLEV